MHMRLMKYDNTQNGAFRAKLDHLKSLINPVLLLEALGFKIFRETSKEIRCNCIIHGGDNPTSFRFNKETHTWVCFSRHCHEIYGGDVFGLVQCVLKLDFMGAVSYLQSITSYTDDSACHLEYKNKKEKELFIKLVNKVSRQIPDFVNEEFLAAHIPFRSNYFIKEGFTKEILDYFEIAGGYVDSFGIIREIIPIRNEFGVLVAYSLRDTSSIVSENKYILTPNFDKDKVLYNLHNVRKHYADDERPLILVEGFKGVWRLTQYGFGKVVATMGAHITSGQTALLCAHDFKKVLIMFDNDVAGVSGAIRVYKALEGKLDVAPIFITDINSNGKGLDPADLSYEQITKYLNFYF